MSTKPFRRVIWVVVDGLGFEHCRRSLEAGGLPGLLRFKTEGHLGPAIPSSPGCETPSALLALFCGTLPEENGVWGYRQPDFSGDVPHSVSGFHVTIQGAPPIWHDVDAAGGGVTILNAAFRHDPLWSGKLSRVDLACDGYRLMAPPILARIGGHGCTLCLRGLELSARPRRGQVEIRKGSRTLARLAAGEGRTIRLTPGTSAFFHLLSDRHLYVNPQTEAVIRSSNPGAVTELLNRGLGRFTDMSLFRAARRLSETEEVPIDTEMLPVKESFLPMSDLFCWATARLPSRLFVGYFSLIDSLNHVYMDLLEDELSALMTGPQPRLPGTGRASLLLRRCMRLVDSLLARLMSVSDQDTLVVLSSDHGSAPYRRMLFMNEVLAGAGLVHRGGKGYCFWRSPAYYHPSDCGQVLFNPGAARSNGLDRRGAVAAVRRTLDAVARIHDVRISAREATPGSPYLLFLYPDGDAYFTGRSPGRPGFVLSRSRRGGHHLSPFTPTPWIDAVLGLWSARQGFRGSIQAPTENREMKRFLLGGLGIS